ncbi:MAG: hypothetical protein HYR56_26845 [Acidobacteria bacterium]|nr:hypothetical protein [Acidobacteriota bacterium]MBI3427868.1 hypothetical protein [Acidobacteriota bacterium]
MKCEEFELSVRELARHQQVGELMDAGLRAQMNEHALGCAACAARLANACCLTEGLRALALSTASGSAPAHVEAALLAAFRQPASATIVPLAAVRARRQWPRWALAAAAMLLIGLLAVALRATLRNTQAPSVTPNALAGKDRAPASVNPPATGIQIVATPGSLAKVEQTLASIHSTTPMTVGKTVQVKAKHLQPQYRIERYLVESEIATDFLPLTENAELPKSAEMRTIRVEVPRVMLSRFGLPMSFERAAEPVKADLLIGPDGQTRAIRFIQTGFEQPQIISANTSKDR